MKRRHYLGTIASAGAIALAGCVSSSDESDDGIGGGIRQDYDEAINTQNGKTYIDIEWKTWFNCSGYTSTPNSEVTLTLEVRALGEVQASEEWVVSYDECMNQQTRTVGFTLDEVYDELLISTGHDSNE